MNDFTERTLTENFPIQLVDDGLGLRATFSISIDGEEVYSGSNPVVFNTGREVPLWQLFSFGGGGDLVISIVEPPNHLYLELFL